MLFLVALGDAPSARAAPPEAPPTQSPTASAGALPESAWQALVGSAVTLTRNDGTVVRGELLGFDATTASIVAADGEVITVPRGDVQSARRTAPAPEPPPEARRPMSEHRGLFLASGIGFGMPMRFSDYEGVGEPYTGDSRILGPGLNLSFAIGGAPVPRLVLGGILDTNVGPGSFVDDWTHDDGSTGVDDRDGRVHTVGLSFFAQGYIRNFFIRGGLGGMGMFFINDGPSDDNKSAGGGGFDLAMGAHFPLARKLALGFAVGSRVAFARFDDDDYKGLAILPQPYARLEFVYF